MMRPSYALPKKQKEALDYIKVHIIAHDQSPTLEEIGDAIGCKKQNVRRLIAALEEAGHITREENKHRSIVLCEEKDNAKPEKEKA